MDENILSEREVGIIKLERAKRMAMIFDQLNEMQVKDMLSAIFQSMHKLKIFNEDYYFIKKILNMEIRRYGGIVKVLSWKEGFILTKAKVMKLIQDIEERI